VTAPGEPDPDEGRAVAGRPVYDPSLAIVTEMEFNGLIAIMRNGAATKPLTPEAQWRRDYHKAMFNRRLVGAQPDLFGGKPVTHMHKAAPLRGGEGPARSARYLRNRGHQEQRHPGPVRARLRRHRDRAVPLGEARERNARRGPKHAGRTKPRALK